MKIISKKYRQDRKKFVEQILIKFGGFILLNQDEFGSKLCCRQSHQNIGKNLYIGQDLKIKGQISADNIGGPIYQSVSSNYHAKWRIIRFHKNIQCNCIKNYWRH